MHSDLAKSLTQHGMKESIEYAFFHCLFVCPLCELIEGFIVCMLHGQFFALDASTICKSMFFLANRRKHFVLLYLLAMMRMVLWTMKMKAVYVSLFPSYGCIHQASGEGQNQGWEEETLFLCWKVAAQLVCINGANLELSDWRTCTSGKNMPTLSS